MIRARVLVPLVNPNEPEARVVDVLVREGEEVAAQAPLCVLETTKATVEVNAPEAGFVRGLAVSVGDVVAAETLLCLLTTTADEAVDEVLSAATSSADRETPAGLRITKPALALARQLGIDLSRLPVGRMVTEAMVRSAAGAPAPAPTPRAAPVAGGDLVIYGGGGHGKAVIDLLRQAGGPRIAGIVDDRLEAGATVMGVAVLGSRSVLPDLARDGLGQAVNAVGALSNLDARVEIFRTLAEHGFACPALVHPRAIVEPSAVLEDGVQVFAGAYIGSEATVRFGTIVNTGAIVSHDCVIGEVTHVAPGAVLAGGVAIGARALIGMGVTTAIGVRIGDDVRIGNGALVHQDVPDRMILSAGSTWPASRHAR